MPILLQKSFCDMGLKFSHPEVQRLNDDVEDHVAKRQTHGRFEPIALASNEGRGTSPVRVKDGSPTSASTARSRPDENHPFRPGRAAGRHPIEMRCRITR